MTSRRRTRLTGKGRGEGRGQEPPHQSGREIDSWTAGWSWCGISILGWGHRRNEGTWALGPPLKVTMGRFHLNFS